MNIGICGATSIKKNTVGGQIDRTNNLVIGLLERWSGNTVNILNTENYRKNIVLLTIEAVKLYMSNNKIIYIVSRRGNLFYTFLFGTLKKISNRELYCIVIGGPPINFFLKHRIFFSIFKKIDGSIYEVNGLKEKMSDLGCKRTFFYPNGKKIREIPSYEYNFDKNQIRICTYSRVSREKGIEDAIRAVEEVNKSFGKNVYILDIYGNIEKSFKNDFEKLIKDKEYIHFKGIIDRKESVNILKEYYLMLFPTHSSVEGIPGGIIDSFEAGVPVIATDISYNSSIIKNKYCGIVYDINDKKGLYKVLVDAFNRPLDYVGMRNNCLSEAKRYDTDYSMNELIKFLEESDK